MIAIVLTNFLSFGFFFLFDVEKHHEFRLRGNKVRRPVNQIPFSFQFFLY